MADQQTQNLALMFVDIPTIGTIREQKGEGEARDCQQRCLALLGDVRKKYAGNLVRSIGGTLLCSFVEAGDAVDAAIGMQEAIRDSGLADSGVRIRMGLHCGLVHVRAGNYSGEVVTMAARMVTLAKAGCIVATGDVLEEAGERVERRFVPLTGEAAERLNLDLYEVSWGAGHAAAEADPEVVPYQPGSAQSKRKTTATHLRSRATVSGLAVRTVTLREVKLPADGGSETPPLGISPAGTPPGAAPATIHLPPLPQQQPQQPQPPPTPDVGNATPRANRLCLIWREKVLQVDSKTAISIGRDAGNDIVLQVSTASRRHAEVCCRDGQFIIIDRSVNGTFIYDDRGEEYYVQNREAKLSESGAICPGCPQEEPGCEALLYWMAE
jgi:hypothetical protein